jgi:DEAD/DEAH box helicase domain-containing protein
MLDHVVVDVEIAHTIEETPGGWDATNELGLAVACLWEYRTSRMRVYGPLELTTLQDRLLAADRISGYNIWKFDFPVIWGFSQAEWSAVANFTGSGMGATRYTLSTKTDDLLRRIWKALGLSPDEFSNSHKGWGLDAVAGSTLGYRKIGYGGDAPKWYQAGQIQRVANYCADDVALERDLTDFVDRYGYVVNQGRVLSVPLWIPGEY